MKGNKTETQYFVNQIIKSREQASGMNSKIMNYSLIQNYKRFKNEK